MNNEREQIINFLLAGCDQKNRTIEEQQKNIAELQQQIAASLPKPEDSKEAKKAKS
jgi:hypothetical protein